MVVFLFLPHSGTSIINNGAKKANIDPASTVKLETAWAITISNKYSLLEYLQDKTNNRTDRRKKNTLE
jgi:hypothetical protein